MKLKEIFVGWDARDFRGLVVGLLGTGIVGLLAYAKLALYIVSKFVVSTSTFVSTRFVNNLYLDASGDPSASALFLISASLVILPLLLTTLTIFAILYYNFLLKRKKPAQPISIETGAVTSEGVEVKHETFIRRNVLYGAMSFSLVLSIIYSGFAITSLYVPMSASVNFHRDLDALNAIIPNQDYRNLVSQWALMNSRTDYNKINLNIKHLADSYKVKLPVPLS